MDAHSLSSLDRKTKPRKMKAVVKKSRFQIFSHLFYRAIEITVVTVTVAKLCYQLVTTFESSGLTSFLLNRHLAFILGNVIVIGLVAKSGFFVNQEYDSPRNSNDFYDEFVRESSRGVRSLQADTICREKQSETQDGVKQSTEENRAKQNTEENRAKQSTEVNRAKQSTEENRAKQNNEEKRQIMVKQSQKQSTKDQRETQKETENNTKESSGEERVSKDRTLKRQIQNIAQNQESTRQIYERSRSENLQWSKKNSCGKLKRSETGRSANGLDSDDELRCKIESFIARQRRNQKDEEFCII